MSKLIRYDLTYVKKQGLWQCKKISKKVGPSSYFVIDRKTTKRQFIKYITKILKMEVTLKVMDGFSIRIHSKTGKFQEERTFPRKLDPRKSKG